MQHPIILAKDYGFGTLFHNRGEFLKALSLHRNDLTELEQKEIWNYAREWERSNGEAGDLERFSTAVEEIDVTIVGKISNSTVTP